MNHYYQLAEDLKLLGELGLNAYRFSISWARIIRENGEVNIKGVAFYRRLIELCRQYQIEPIVCLYHDDLPAYLEEQGGWGNRRILAKFVRYASVLFDCFGEEVRYWQTISEQNLLTQKKISRGKESLKAIYQANHHLFLAQALVVKEYQQRGLKGKIGPAPNIVPIYSHSFVNDQEVTQQLEIMRNWLYLDVSLGGAYSKESLAILEKLGAVPAFQAEDESILTSVGNFISFSYGTSLVAAQAESGPHVTLTPIDPADVFGIELSLSAVYQRYPLPIFIMVRSLGLAESIDEKGQVVDYQRINFLKKQIGYLASSLNNGVNLIGYAPWSVFDVLSSDRSRAKGYGLIYVEEGQGYQPRIPKASFDWYQSFIRKERCQDDRGV